MNHPAYRAFETQTAALSLFPNLYIKFLPPSWNAPTPPTPHVSAGAQEDAESAEAKQKREWKRRIKMYCKSDHSLCGSTFLITIYSGSSNRGVWLPARDIRIVTFTFSTRDVARWRLV